MDTHAGGATSEPERREGAVADAAGTDGVAAGELVRRPDEARLPDARTPSAEYRELDVFGQRAEVILRAGVGSTGEILVEQGVGYLLQVLLLTCPEGARGTAARGVGRAVGGRLDSGSGRDHAIALGSVGRRQRRVQPERVGQLHAPARDAVVVRPP